MSEVGEDLAHDDWVCELRYEAAWAAAVGAGQPSRRRRLVAVAPPRLSATSASARRSSARSASEERELRESVPRGPACAWTGDAWDPRRPRARPQRPERGARDGSVGLFDNGRHPSALDTKREA